MQVTITAVGTDADLEDMIRVQARVRPDWRPKLENLRHHLDSNPDLTYFVGRLGEEPVACGFVEPSGPFAQGDVAVVPARRGGGIGSSLFAEVSAQTRALGKDEIQGEAQERDAESIAFFERRGFARVGGEKALVLELGGIEPPEIDPPEGVHIVTRAEEPDRLEGMYAVARQADEDIPGSAGVQSFERWRANDIDRPNTLPELCFIALACDEVVGYAVLQAHEERALQWPHRNAAGLEAQGRRLRAEARPDRGREARGPRTAAHRERGAQRAHAAAEREARLRPGSGRSTVVLRGPLAP